MDPYKCINCQQHFDLENKTPLVLPCGDSICTLCLYSYIERLPNVYKCSMCGWLYEITSKFIKKRPKNNAVMTINNSQIDRSLRPGPVPKVLFNTPEPKRLSDSPYKSFGYMTPSTYSSPLQFTSPNSVAMKCARPGCNNDRYYLNGEVWDYCCINCRDACRMLLKGINSN